MAQDTSEGAITYVESSYARNAGFPVAKMLNAANYYVEPTAANVAVALLNARIQPDLTLDPSGVYTNSDPRAYPLSGYSYMIIPKGTASGFTTEKGRTLSEFAYYFLCEGQQQADALGYSPLPINLVQASLDQVNQIPGSTGKLNRNDLRQCNNPTFSADGTNLLARNAPQPDPCDRRGAPTPCRPGAPPPGPPSVPRPIPPPAPAPPGATATTTTLAVARFPFPGIPAFLNATVSPRFAPGTVQFLDGGSALGAPVPVVFGAAFLAASTLAPGTHSLTAVFTPADPATFASSSSPPVSLTVPGRSTQMIFEDLLRFLQSLLGGAPR